MLLRRLTQDQLTRDPRPAVDPDARAVAQRVLDDVESRGRAAIIEHATRLGDLAPNATLVYTRAHLRAALDATDPAARRLLEHGAANIHAFADAQRAALVDIDVPVPGGRAGHRFVPVSTAGCYAPGGRYPLPSTVLMTGVTARAAGVANVWLASPRPSPIILAAAAIADADALVALGGAQAIASFLHGFGDLPPCDVIVGPGNKYVTAAKSIVAAGGRARIDMLAGPSEVLVIADKSADPALIAADLLAQAEHDDDAVPELITTSAELIDAVETELLRQLEALPTAATARRALANGFACVVPTLDDAAALADRLAPEHLQLMTRDDERLAARLRNYGSLFIGPRTAETLGDYALGPNHTLPTGGTARFSSGLSVLTFLNTRTWLRLGNDAPSSIFTDAAAFARLEGLGAHARAAERRAAAPMP